MASVATVKPGVDRLVADLDTLVGNEVVLTTKKHFRIMHTETLKEADRASQRLKPRILTTRTAALEISS